MQSNLIIKNMVKRKPLYLYLQLIIMYKLLKCKLKIPYFLFQTPPSNRRRIWEGKSKINATLL